MNSSNSSKKQQSVIEFNSVSKRFFKRDTKTLKELFPTLFNLQKSDGAFWALKDLSFDIPRGGTVGVIGRNGSGKSTLLKLIAGVTKPTKGKVSVKGRIVPLIELGAGFHHELTGRENTYLNGVILGLTRREIDEQFDSIVKYSGLEEFIDTPVKHYSSGMYVRLAFAIAVHSKPEILLVDEILAVGDIAFQEKCLASIQAFSKNKETTVLMVAHSPALIERFCDTVVWLDQGELKKIGDPKQIMPEYLEASVTSESIRTKSEKIVGDIPEETEGKPLKIVAVTSVNDLGQEKKVIHDEPLKLRIVLHAYQNFEGYAVGVMIKTLAGDLVWERNSLQDKCTFTKVKAGQKQVIELTLPPLLNSGTYTLTFALSNEQGVVWQWLKEYLTIKVVRDIQTGSTINHSIEYKELPT